MNVVIAPVVAQPRFMRSLGKNGVTLLEIVIAMAILAITMLPVFFMISKGTTDSDFNIARAFALNRATEILNAILDNVPFQALRQGVPAFIRVDDLVTNPKYGKFDDVWAAKMADILFPGSDSNKSPAGYPCRGIARDTRGIAYLVTLRVEDVPSPKASTAVKPELLAIGTAYPTSPAHELELLSPSEPTFSYLKNPIILTSQSFTETYNPNPFGLPPPARFEVELPKKVSESGLNFYDDEGYAGFPAAAFRFKSPTSARMTQRLAKAKVSYTNDPDFTFCALKKVIIEVQWNMSPALYPQPETVGPTTRRIHLMTIKADLDE